MARPSKITIDLNALLHNLDLIKQKVQGAKVIAMVKANAYGHGLDVISQALSQKVDGFGVSCIEEAKQIRAIGLTDKIVLLEGCFERQELSWVEKNDCAIVIHSKPQLDTFLKGPFKKPLEIWLKLDSGMHRLGFTPKQWNNAFTALHKNKNIKPPIVLMSHLANADSPLDPMNQKQKNCFDKVGKDLNVAKSFANSAAILLHEIMNYDYVRPGIMLYGVSPVVGKTGKHFGLKPVMHFSSEIFAIKTCHISETVGYGARFKAKRTTKVALVAVGYGDGYPRHINENAYVLVTGQKAPVIGNVSMDILAIDITDISMAKIGSEVILWGEKLPVEKVAQFSNTIAYELLCRAPLRAFRQVKEVK